MRELGRLAFWLLVAVVFVSVLYSPGDEGRDGEGEGGPVVRRERADPRAPGEGPSGAGGADRPADPVPSNRSALPCQALLSWRVGDVDPRWGLDRGDVRAAARRAAELWEQAAGRRLFRHDPADGLPIHVEYDESQVRLQQRWRRLDSVRAALDDSVEALGAAGRRLRARQEELNRRVRRHNERVEELDGRGGASAAEREEVLRAGRALERAQDRLDARQAAFERRRRRLERARDRVRDEVEDYNRSVELSPPMRTGGYSENVSLRGDRVVSVEDRSITVRSFVGRSGLVNVLAHELGHALGLGHVRDSGAVMAEVRETRRASAEPSIRPGDRRELRRRCPDLVRTR